MGRNALEGSIQAKISLRSVKSVQNCECGFKPASVVLIDNEYFESRTFMVRSDCQILHTYLGSTPSRTSDCINQFLTKCCRVPARS